jgi:hypothetical protein
VRGSGSERRVRRRSVGTGDGDGDPTPTPNGSARASRRARLIALDPPPTSSSRSVKTNAGVPSLKFAPMPPGEIVTFLNPSALDMCAATAAMSAETLVWGSVW